MAAPTVEVIDADRLREGETITTDIGLFIEIISKINWKEPLIFSVMAAHLVVCICIIGLRKKPYILGGILVILGIFCFLSEYINEWAATNQQYLSLSEQYFDSSGVFISIIFSIPIIFNCFLILILLILESCSTMQKVAVLKIKHKKK